MRHYASAAERFALPALGRGRRSRPTGKMIRRVKLLEIAAESPASGAPKQEKKFPVRKQKQER